MRRLTYLVATSIDGFLAAPDGEAEFFSRYVDEQYLEFYGTAFPEALPTHARRMTGFDSRPNARFDAVLMGRATYEVGLPDFTSPYGHLEQYVVSRSITEQPGPGVHLLCGDIAESVRELKKQPGKDIWLCGGTDLAGQLAEQIDDLVIKTYPCFLGSGMALSGAPFAVREFTLDSVHTFDCGIVVTDYRRA